MNVKGPWLCHEPLSRHFLIHICRSDSLAKTFTYPEIVKYFRFDEGSKEWIKRRNRKDAIARVFIVHPNDDECYHLLLHRVPGPTSFVDLRTFGSVICATYKEACMMLELLENDQQWDLAL